MKKYSIKNNKIALGTVQFGLDYGINNTKGKVKPNDVTSILKYANMQSIDVIDTAKAYGNSENVLGENNLIPFKVITKIVSNQDIKFQVFDSLNKLHINTLYAVLVHDFEIFKKNSDILEQLQYLKKNKLIEKVGFSLNRIAELDYLLDNKIDFDIVQIPYNLFDRRFEVYFEQLKNKDVEIHTRSAFLQGLFFMKIESIPNYLKEITPNIKKVNDLVDTYDLNIASLALNFVIKNKFVDKVVIGVTSKSELESNINTLKDIGIVTKISNNLDSLSISDEKLISPLNWKK